MARRLAVTGGVHKISAGMKVYPCRTESQVAGRWPAAEWGGVDPSRQYKELRMVDALTKCTGPCDINRA